MNAPLFNAPTPAQMAKVSGMLRGKHSHENIAAATSLTVEQVAGIARALQPKAKTWNGRRLC